MGFLFLSLTMLGGMLALTLGAAFFFIRFVFSIVFLPFKLVFGLLLFPIWVARAVLKLLSAVLILPVLLVGGLIVGLGFALAALVTAVIPLVPFVLLGLIVWGLVRVFTRPQLVRPY
jgi:hypothetical protein